MYEVLDEVYACQIEQFKVAHAGVHSGNSTLEVPLSSP